MNNDNNRPMPLTTKNYILMLIGALIIAFGFILMSGGGDHTATHFDETIYSTLRITVAPIIVILGFAFEVYAIMKRFTSESDNK